MAEDSSKVLDTAEVTKDVLAPADGPRENLISTAVKFLQNPKVHQSPLHQKKSFLEKKGLTKEEIDIAVQRSGVGDNTQIAPPRQPQYPPGPFHQAPLALQPAPLPSTWSRVRDFTTTAVIVTSISYAVYRLYQLYIRPWLLGKAAIDDSRMERLEKKLEELQSLNETMVQVQSTLTSIQESLTAQQASLAVLSQRSIHGQTSETQVKDADSSLLQDVKSEVSSLKGLLLSRRQFPAVPQTSPVLPTWQLTNSSSTVTSSDSSSSQSNGPESSSSGDVIAAASSQPEETERLTGGDNSSCSQGQMNTDSDSVSATESAILTQTTEVEVKGHQPHSDYGDSSKVKDTPEDSHNEVQAVSASS